MPATTYYFFKIAEDKNGFTTLEPCQNRACSIFNVNECSSATMHVTRLYKQKFPICFILQLNTLYFITTKKEKSGQRREIPGRCSAKFRSALTYLLKAPALLEHIFKAMHKLNCVARNQYYFFTSPHTLALSTSTVCL